MTIGAALLAELLTAVGVRTGFAYPGTSELALCVELSRTLPEGLRQPYGDASAVFMGAGACANEPGTAVAVLHGARGLGAACGAIADVARNEWGLVVVVGLPSTTSARFLPPHGEPAMVEAVGGFAKGWLDLGHYAPDDMVRQEVVDDVVRQLLELIHTTRLGPAGPVLLGFPQDLAECDWAEPSFLPVRSAGTSHASAPAELPVPDLQAAAQLLAGSDRVGVLVDDYFFRWEGAQRALASFSALHAAPVFQVGYRRGPMLFPTVDPGIVRYSLGKYAPGREVCRQFLENVDMLVTVEDRNMYPRVVGPLPDCRKLAVTSSRRRTSKNGYLAAGDLVIEGDPAAVLNWLSKADGGRPRTGRSWLADRPAGHSTLVETPAPRVAILADAVLQGIVDSGVRSLVDDSQALGGALALFDDKSLSSLHIFGDHGGYVGSGLAFATGLALSRGEQVACLLGDHAFVNGLQGLFSVARYKAPVCFLISSNGGSVTLTQQARDSFGKEAGESTNALMAAPRLDVVAFAQSVGIAGHRLVINEVQAALDPLLLRERVREIASAGGPAVIELCLPDSPSAWAGIWHSRGLDEV